MSRLLTQFLMSDVVVVSIDESSFKQAGVPRRCWQADPGLVRQLYHKQPEAPPQADVSGASSSDDAHQNHWAPEEESKAPSF